MRRSGGALDVDGGSGPGALGDREWAGKVGFRSSSVPRRVWSLKLLADWLPAVHLEHSGLRGPGRRQTVKVLTVRGLDAAHQRDGDVPRCRTRSPRLDRAA